MKKRTGYRAEDGVHVVPAPETRWQVLTVFGYPLGGPAAFDGSAALLEAERLAERRSAGSGAPSRKPPIGSSSPAARTGSLRGW
ncbi:hypothetical protein DL991_01150 [Amycolatopsis sp. WAC 01375]|nr:hypothetical protein DL991_01150 [Amycolatopsis sp. WAC 01375]RSN37962.1 hypothetical protein DL990_02775 [Amycolatopsis sp. WAC 01416]